MKNLFHLFSITMLIISCSKDNDTPTPTTTQSELILGKWEHTTDKLVQGDGTVVEGPYGGNASGCDKDYKTFSAGGYEAGDYINVGGICDLSVPNGTWSITDNKIKLGSSTFDIVILTETDFAYKINSGASGSQTFFMKKVN